MMSTTIRYIYLFNDTKKLTFLENKLSSSLNCQAELNRPHRGPTQSGHPRPAPVWLCRVSRSEGPDHYTYGRSANLAWNNNYLWMRVLYVSQRDNRAWLRPLTHGQAHLRPPACRASNQAEESGLKGRTLGGIHGRPSWGGGATVISKCGAL